MRGLDALKLKFCQRIEAITAVEKGKYFVCTVTASASITASKLANKVEVWT